jgi:hypothetical protein
MKKGLLFTAICLTTIMSSCGPRWGDAPKPTSESRSAGEFSAIDISAPVDVTITVKPGAATSVTFIGLPERVKEIETEVKDSTLYIAGDEVGDWHFNFWMDDEDDIRAEIVVSSLSAISLSGAAEVKTMGDISCTSFMLTVSGAGDIKIAKITADKLEVDASGAADVDIKSGVVRYAEYGFSGAGDLDAFGLQSEEVSAAVSGAGDLKVNASKTLSASISGVGTIRYKGHPQVNKDVSGVGSISDAN